jgi:hypothetical protein
MSPHVTIGQLLGQLMCDGHALAGVVRYLRRAVAEDGEMSPQTRARVEAAVRELERIAASGAALVRDVESPAAPAAATSTNDRGGASGSGPGAVGEHDEEAAE